MTRTAPSPLVRTTICALIAGVLNRGPDLGGAVRLATLGLRVIVGLGESGLAVANVPAEGVRWSIESGM
jgi:mannose/fructose/N-acetylgalactosamine-specific phosphotransferase system component IIC